MIVLQVHKVAPLSLCPFFTLHSSSIYAQVTSAPGTNVEQEPARFIPLSPQAWSFMRYGGDTPNLYTGTVNVSIPLYTYKDIDFEIPISATYASNGYNPNELQGTLGLGWILNVGGMITREVRGAVDDFYGHPGTPTFLVPPEISDKYYYGYYFRHMLNEPNSLQSSLDRLKNDAGPWNPYFDLIKRRFYETESDIYSFNFLGHSGKFVLAPEQKVLVYSSNHPSGEYAVQLFTEKIGNEPDTEIRIYKICITTGDGYKYTFINQCAPNQLGDIKEALYFGSTTAERYLTWYLDRIDSPSGRSVKFHYSQIRYARAQPYIKDYGWLDSSAAIGKYECNNYVAEYAFKSVTGDVRIPTYTDLQLHSIETDMGTIEFSYSQKPRQQYYEFASPYIYELLFNTNLLKKIEVKDIKNNIIGQHNFHYKYTQGNSISLLDSIMFLDGRKYAMSYYHENKEFPCFGVTYVDYGGYFSGYPSDPEYNIYRRKTVRQTTSHDGTMYGMLKKIIYPTGGSSEFEYEQNDYSRIITRHNEDGDPYLTDTEGMNVTGAGVRIKKITEKPSENVPGTSREYIYYENNLSTGISLYYPSRMFLGKVENTIETRSNSIVPIYKTNKIYNLPANANIYIDRPFIEYSKVIEKNSDGSRSEYEFSTYADVPDDTTIFDSASYLDGNLQNKGYHTNWFRTPASMAANRGKLLRKTIYNDLGYKVKQEIMIYDKAVQLPYLEQARPGNYYYYLTKQYVGEYPLVEQQNIEYFDNGTDSICVYQFTEYNTLNQKRKISHQLSDGRLKSVCTTYVGDIDKSVQDTIHKTLIQTNLLNYPLKQTITIGNNNDIVGDTLFNYSLYPLMDDGSSKGIYPRLTEKKAALMSKSPSSNSSLSYRSLGQYKYGEFGRVVEITNPAGQVTSFVWGYGGTQIIAMIENLPLEELLKIPGFSSVNKTPFSGSLSAANNNALRSIANVYVTTYTYEELKGLSQIEDPAGRKLFYEYTDDGKLECIKDNKGNIINQYEYHFSINNK